MMLGVIFGMPGWGEMLILAAAGLLIFGKRLPEMGKGLGRAIVEFKRGLSGVDHDVHTTGQLPATHQGKQMEKLPPTHTADAQETPLAPIDAHTHP